jgi:hypothetical protein
MPLFKVCTHSARPSINAADVREELNITLRAKHAMATRLRSHNELTLDLPVLSEWTVKQRE